MLKRSLELQSLARQPPGLKLPMWKSGNNKHVMWRWPDTFLFRSHHCCGQWHVQVCMYWWSAEAFGKFWQQSSKYISGKRKATKCLLAKWRKIRWERQQRWQQQSWDNETFPFSVLRDESWHYWEHYKEDVWWVWGYGCSLSRKSQSWAIRRGCLFLFFFFLLMRISCADNLVMRSR